jgi:hypothetical protein
MKKFFLTILILAILGGAAFFFGWAQFAVPPGAYGVLRSKTHGLDPQLIRSGEFRWVWYRLIPSNVSTSVFRIGQVNHDLNASGILPSGNTYAAFAGNQADFSWQIGASLSFFIRPDALVSLVSENDIGNQEELSAYERNLAEKIGAFVLRYINAGENAAGLEELMAGNSEVLGQNLAEQFPMIENFSCLIKDAVFPDFVLYGQVRSLYEDFIAKQREYAAAAIDSKAGTRIDAQLRFSDLERYGELLSKYPVLLDFLAQERALKE